MLSCVRIEVSSVQDFGEGSLILKLRSTRPSGFVDLAAIFCFAPVAQWLERAAC